MYFSYNTSLVLLYWRCFDLMEHCSRLFCVCHNTFCVLDNLRYTQRALLSCLSNLELIVCHKMLSGKLTGACLHMDVRQGKIENRAGENG